MKCKRPMVHLPAMEGVNNCKQCKAESVIESLTGEPPEIQDPYEKRFQVSTELEDLLIQRAIELNNDLRIENSRRVLIWDALMNDDIQEAKRLIWIQRRVLGDQE